MDQRAGRARDDLAPPTQPRLEPVDPAAKTAVAAGTPRRPDILVLCPLHQEFVCVRNELAKFTPRQPSMIHRIPTRYHGVFEIGRQTFWLVQCGLGAKSAAMARPLIETIDPDAVCLLGFAGALDETFMVGDVVEPATIHSTWDVRVVTPVPLKLAHNNESMLTSIEIVATPQAKANLYARHGCATVDMEAFEVGRVCEDFGKPFHTARSISDAADEPFPKELLGVIRPTGDLSTGRLALAVAMKPALVRPLYRLWKNSRRAKAGLRDLAQRLVKALS